MNKSNTKWFLLSGVLVAGLAMGAPHNALADNNKNEVRAGKSQSLKSNVRVPLDNVKVVYNGQTYTLSGDLHGVLMVKPQGDGYFIKGHLNAQGIKVTAPDGTTYNGVGAINAQIRTGDDNATFKLVGNVGLIGKGKAPNFRLKLNLRGSVETNQTVTVTPEDITLGA